MGQVDIVMSTPVTRVTARRKSPLILIIAIYTSVMPQVAKTEEAVTGNTVTSINAAKVVALSKSQLVQTIVLPTNVCMVLAIMDEAVWDFIVQNTNVRKSVVIVKNRHFPIIAYYTMIKGANKNGL